MQKNHRVKLRICSLGTHGRKENLVVFCLGVAGREEISHASPNSLITDLVPVVRV